jgi:hypothetical protein
LTAWDKKLFVHLVKVAIGAMADLELHDRFGHDLNCCSCQCNS